VAIIFALTLTVAVMSIGAAIDFARGLNAQTQLQAAADSAVLAAARNAIGTTADLQAVADAVFEANRPNSTGLSVTSANLTVSGNALNYSVTGTLPTTLARVTGHMELNLSASSGAYRKTDKTEI
jgi:Flp pilus assembly protein TadG